MKWKLAFAEAWSWLAFFSALRDNNHDHHVAGDISDGGHDVSVDVVDDDEYDDDDDVETI